MTFPLNVRFSTLCFVFLSLFYAQHTYAAKKISSPPLSISMVSSNAIDQSLPFDALNGKGWKASANAEYVKLHLYFDKNKDV